MIVRIVEEEIAEWLNIYDASEDEIMTIVM